MVIGIAFGDSQLIKYWSHHVVSLSDQ